MRIIIYRQGRSRITHGLTKHPLYSRWHNMMHRCYDERSVGFYLYGGRGISVCKRWHDVRNFIQDLYPSYKNGLTLDRKNNNRGYSPNNCRWATPLEQGANSRHNKWYTINGKTMTISQWIRLKGLKSTTVHQRIHAYGWSVERSLGIGGLIV